MAHIDDAFLSLLLLLNILNLEYKMELSSNAPGLYTVTMFLISHRPQ